MNIVYLRYNKHYPQKAEKIKDNYTQYGKVELIPTTSGKKLLKKEVKEIEKLVKEKKPEKLYIVNLAEEEKEKLNHLDVEIELFNDEKIKNISNKLEIMIKILRELVKRDINTKDDFEWFKSLFKENDKTTTKTTFLNYMNDLQLLFNEIIQKKNLKDSISYSMLKGDNILQEIFEKIDDIEEISILLESLTDDLVKKLSSKTQKFLKSDKKFLLYKTRPFEKLNDNFIFSEFRRAILEKRYINIIGYGMKINNKGYNLEDYQKVIPLKIVFMENNWYLAGVVSYNNEKIVRFFRLAFIDDFEIVEKYPSKELKLKYLKFLETFETPFTLYGEPWKTAILKIDKSIAHYFENKNHFPKQEPLIKPIDRNNFLIKVAYTQPIEILPIIKKWLPNITIIESQNNELQTILKKDLQKALENYK